MTIVRLAPRRENPASATESVAAGLFFQVRPSRAYASGGQWVLPEWSDPLEIPSGGYDMNLDALADPPYELRVWRTGNPEVESNLVIHEWRIITDEVGTPGWETFTQVAGPGAAASLPSDFEARLAALEAAAPSGPATDISQVGGVSAFAQTYLDDTSAATMRTTIGAADATAVVTLTGAQSVSGTKTFTAANVGTLTATTAATVPTPSASGHAATKAYVDSTVSAGAPQATASVTGIIRLTGDLGGTATAPQVAKVNGVAVSGTPSAGQVPVASNSTTAVWGTVSAVVSGISSVPGLQAALDAKMAAGIAGLPKCALLVVRKDPVTGFWPTSYGSDGSAVYTGGSASTGVRPTADADRVVVWMGALPTPPLVSSGTAGVRDGVDVVLAFGA